MVKNFPTLYGLAKVGTIKVWRIWVEQADSSVPAAIHVTHGYLGGQQQETVRVIKQGKNVGRANQTSAFEQACAEAESTWKKKQDGNYRTEIPKEDELTLLPMLAKRYQDQGHKIRWPCLGQPKLNGVRCLAWKASETEVVYTSRAGKEYKTLEHLTPQILKAVPVGTVLDGEIFNRDLTFQEIVKRVKRVKASRHDIETDPVKYHVYDMVDRTLTFAERWSELQEMLAVEEATTGLVVLEQTREFATAPEFQQQHQRWTGEGYEGTMLRNKQGLYVPDYRSDDLQKYKDFMDEEFVVVGGHEGIGKDTGTVIFDCKTERGQVFSVRPKGTHAERTEYWTNLDQYVGKMLTVRYQNRSDDGIPIFPVGLYIRDFE